MSLDLHRRLPGLAALWGAKEGAAALEFALVSLFLIALLTGVGSIGIALYMAMEVQSAARAGAAYASSRKFVEADIKKATEEATILGVQVNARAVRTHIPSCLTEGSGVLTATLTCAVGGLPAHYATVTTEFRYTPLFPLPQLTDKDGKLVLSGKSIARLPGE